MENKKDNITNDTPTDSGATAEATVPKKDKAQKSENDKGNAQHDESQSLKDMIRINATEDDAPMTKGLTLNKILGGDILMTTAIRRQIWLFLLIAFFMLIYISNRYSCQQDLIEINKLEDRLQDAKYKALSSSSQMTERSRESNVLELLKSNNDSTLKTPNQPPYIITVPEE